MVRALLARPVDAAWLAAFRLAFGAIIVWEVYRYFRYDWIWAYWLEPTFHFTYLGFGWLRPWPGSGMYVHFAVLGLTALAMLIGLWYRAAAIVLALAFAYQFLLEQARYLNHFYAALLFAAFFACLPGAAEWSVDRWDARRRGAAGPAVVPLWTLWLLRLQVAVIYIYAGLAKLNEDWLTGAVARPMILSIWPGREWAVSVMVYGGLAFDLLVVPALLWRRTRLLAFAAAVGFHLANAQLFEIGIFPWMMLAATTVFFEPDWPRRALAALEDAPAAKPHPLPAGPPPRPISGRLLLALGVYAFAQLTVPLRHWLYPGDVNWTEEGHRFSWRMMLNRKQGTAQFSVQAGDRTIPVDTRAHLAPWQERAMSYRPDMILQFAHFLAAEHRATSGGEVRIHVDARTAVNGRPPQALIDPRVDLASQPRTLGPAPWILPPEHW